MVNNEFQSPTSTMWDDLSPVSKTLIRMFAAAPIWRLTDFEKPPVDCMEELLAAAWNRSSFREQDLRSRPEVVAAAVRELVAGQLRAN